MLENTPLQESEPCDTQGGIPSSEKPGRWAKRRLGAIGPSQDQSKTPYQRLKTLVEFGVSVLEHGTFQVSATAFVNEITLRLKCDRVSLGWVRGGEIRLQTMSNTTHFGRKTNLVRAIEAAMEEALVQASTIDFPDAAHRRGSEFRITRAHADLFRQYGSGSICSIPLTSNEQILGVLTLERPEGTNFDQESVQLCETALGLASPIFDLKYRDERSLAVRHWDCSRNAVRRLLGPRHPRWKLAAVGAASLVLFFCLAKGNYRIPANTVLEASMKRAAVAPFDGYIQNAGFRAGDIVSKGDVLCVLDDREIRLEHLKWQSQRSQLDKQYQQALAQHDAAQVKIISAQIDRTKHELHLTESHLNRTKVVSPLSGVVVDGDLSQSIGAPVERGDVLFETAPLDSYRVILQVDEMDIEEIAPGQQGSLVLSAFPTQHWSFAVEKITPVSFADGGRNYFRVEARLNDSPDGRLRPGMEGIGKIEIDRRLLFWIWTHKAFDWLRLSFWIWIP